MPRTKLPKKRNRKSVATEAEMTCLLLIDQALEDKLGEDNITFETSIQLLENAIRTIKLNLPEKYLHMTLGELAEVNLSANKSGFTSATNATLENTTRKNHINKYSKDDEGKR